MIPVINNPQFGQFQILQNFVHGANHPWPILELELKTISSSSPDHKKVQFRPSMRFVEITCTIGLDILDDLFHRKSLPRKTKSWISKQLFHTFHSEQRMQQAGIPEVHLRRFNEPLPCVFKPRRQLSNHEGTCQDVEIVTGRVFLYPHGPSQIRCVPDLAVKMREHGPKTT